MNRKEAAELLPFIKAFGEGKDIEIRSKNTHAQLNGWAKMVLSTFIRSTCSLSSVG